MSAGVVVERFLSVIVSRLPAKSLIAPKRMIAGEPGARRGIGLDLRPNRR